MRAHRATLALLAGWVALGGLGPAGLWAQYDPAPSHSQPYKLDSGVHQGSGPNTAVVYSALVEAPGAPWLRLHFNGYNLGQGSYVMLTSLLTNDHQYHDAKTLGDWNSSSATFNGDIVEVELHVAPGESGIFIQINELTVGEWVGGKMLPKELKSLCGSDNRIGSTDPAVGRLFGGGCTAWLTSKGTLLTAGHCTDFDPDQSGPLLPDGVLDLSGNVEFNVPSSLSDGTPVAAAANDQYPIDTTTVVWEFDGSGQGLGKDWGVFECNANSNTGLLPHIAQGAFYRMTRESPSAGNTIRITGYGVDMTPTGSGGGRNSDNVTEQTHTGPYVGETNSSGDIYHEYQVDTEGANSGSPIIWNSQGLTLGIHTNAGCGGANGNTGTSFEHNALQNAINNFFGSNYVHVDEISGAPSETGNILGPYDTVNEGIANVVSGGTVSIASRNYTKAEGNIFTAGADGKAMTLLAPVGTVTIGH